MCVTSPPYYGLRDYGVDGQIGLEDTPEQFISRLVDVFREVRRVLKDDGTLWVNIGDSYCGTGDKGDYKDPKNPNGRNGQKMAVNGKLGGAYKSKDLIGIPWMLAFALRNDGWFLRQDIIWCISGGAWLYVKTKTGIKPMMVKDLIRLDPKTVQLWNGEKWVNVFGYGETNDKSEKLELVLRSGERIGCTGNHKWVTKDGRDVKAKDLVVGDVLKTTTFPDEASHTPKILTEDVLWLIGLYIAEGSHSCDCIQLSLCSDEKAWLERIESAIKSVGGTMTFNLSGNQLNVRLYSKVFNAILSQYVGGKTAKDKHLNSICWDMPNSFLKNILQGYFDGDGHYDKFTNRVRIGFTRNYYWERDLRTLAARLGATITLKPTFSKIKDRKYPSFRGEWRWNRSNHFNEKDRAEIVEIRKSKARHFYDISVDCDNHLFALASGVLTHNCKPNPMPESVTDRCTKSHEYIFLLSKYPKYYFDHEAIQEEAKQEWLGRYKYGFFNGKEQANFRPDGASNTAGIKKPQTKHKNLQENGQQNHSMHERRAQGLPDEQYAVRNKRDVWTVTTKPYSGAHFATYPEDLIKPCILAGSREGDLVLDPFNGAATTGVVCKRLKRDYLGIELNPEYIKLSNDRLEQVDREMYMELNQYNLFE